MEFATIDYNNIYLLEYVPVILFIVIALGIIGLILLTSFIIAPRKAEYNKLQPYESGIDTFQDAKQQFNVKFYLIAILFIIFDIEIIFMYPWALSLASLNNYGFFSMIIFLFLLIIGFIYEWKKGVLD